MIKALIKLLFSIHVFIFCFVHPHFKEEIKLFKQDRDRLFKHIDLAFIKHPKDKTAAIEDICDWMEKELI